MCLLQNVSIWANISSSFFILSAVIVALIPIWRDAVQKKNRKRGYTKRLFDSILLLANSFLKRMNDAMDNADKITAPNINIALKEIKLTSTEGSILRTMDMFQLNLDLFTEEQQSIIERASLALNAIYDNLPGDNITLLIKTQDQLIKFLKSQIRQGISVSNEEDVKSIEKETTEKEKLIRDC